jgi:Uma2 family endonuclease
MSTHTESTLDDLRGVDGKAEIVQGGIVRMSPAGGRHNRSAGRIYISLVCVEKMLGKGAAFTDNTAFIVDLPGRQTFSPDVAYYYGEISDDFLHGAPALAVEIRSPRDFGDKAEARLARKRADYFAAGTQVLWDVDISREKLVRVFRATQPEQPTIYRIGDLAEAEPAVPDWRIPVKEFML